MEGIIKHVIGEPEAKKRSFEDFCDSVDRLFSNRPDMADVFRLAKSREDLESIPEKARKQFITNMKATVAEYAHEILDAILEVEREAGFDEGLERAHEDPPEPMYDESRD